MGFIVLVAIHSTFEMGFIFRVGKFSRATGLSEILPQLLVPPLLGRFEFVEDAPQVVAIGKF